MKPIHRGVVGLTEPGAATSAMVALTASQRAVAHYVSSGTIGIGTGRFGIRGTHLEPLADLTCPHILQESLPKIVLYQKFDFVPSAGPPPVQIHEVLERGDQRERSSVSLRRSSKMAPRSPSTERLRASAVHSSAGFRSSPETTCMTWTSCSA